ncbi:C-C motif chemokine 21 [Centrocercus urophasianus]|uniref:C-C motif chemokine 21 n=1 Tax=Centrocercus urophasianus TaxID=9002 RepID=UPI001C64BCB1|nr:C-C motif chemokine 21 [Centrocercus urophasianus]XP_042718321.1 C-C motif chemokine 21 [Lagopus leucura]XP_052526595.1 C-C motif chemokine 21 [Tympanuchus pallidicinctus]
MALRVLLPLLLLAASLLLHQAEGVDNPASDCCLKTSQKTIPIKLVKTYSIQGPESGCVLRAVVFTTKKNMKICSSPTDPTVQKLIKSLDNRRKNPSQRKPKRQKKKQV